MMIAEQTIQMAIQIPVEPELPISSFSGDLNKTLGDYATWEITDDQLLRIFVGDQFPDNIVMNYSLNSDAVEDFQADTYQAVSATGTGLVQIPWLFNIIMTAPIFRTPEQSLSLL